MATPDLWNLNRTEKGKGGQQTPARLTTKRPSADNRSAYGRKSCLMVHAETRRLAAIMFTDIVGFSRQMGADEARMLRLLDLHNQVIQQAVAAHHGMVIKTIGDAFLLDFPAVGRAVRCAQQLLAKFRSPSRARGRSVPFHAHIA